MLPSEIPLRRTHHRLVRLLAFVLGEAFLGLLAIVAVALTLFPMLFAVPAAVADMLAAAQWTIVGLFALEYLLALKWSDDRRAFLRDAWRWLDLITIIVPLATILPSVSTLLRSSMILRAVRLIRIVSFSVRVSGTIVRHEAHRTAASTAVPPTRVTRLHHEQPAEIAWADFWRQLQTADESWYHIQHPTAEDLGKIAAATGTTPEILRTHLTGTGFPHIETVGPYAGFFAWVPELSPSGEITRCGLFFLLGEKRLLSFSQRATSLLTPPRPAPPASAELPTQSFAERMTRSFFRAALQQNERLVGIFTTELRSLEEVPVRESRTEFFERTFRLKKELSAAQADLWRLKSLLTELAEAPACLPGVAAEAAAEFHRMADDAAYLHETIVSLREEVLSLIDLHINVVSFDMNRVIRLLAVISALGLIPAVVGGLLGMNLADNPWPVTLPQVAFGVCLGMVLGLYLFFVKGWLR
jgi:Mg2+ and Co2+ transporter CorA